MAKNSNLLRPFARSILAKVYALSELGLTKNQKARFLESISDDIKKCSNFVVPKTSQAALKEAKRLGIDLRTKNWHDQPRFDKGRKNFHFEHLNPVSAIRAECLQAMTESKIINILKHKLCVVWLLKNEDAKLTELGFRNKRPDPKSAYRNAGIQLVE